MQLELLRQEECRWRVIKVVNGRFGNQRWPIYVKTVPVDWREAEPTDVLPWEQ